LPERSLRNEAGPVFVSELNWRRWASYIDHIKVHEEGAVDRWSKPYVSDVRSKTQALEMLHAVWVVGLKRIAEKYYGGIVNSQPRPLLAAEHFVSFKSGEVGFVSRPKSKDQNASGGDGKNCHDPLCERIARANERPQEPVPISAYLAVALFLAAFGVCFTYFVSLIVEPQEKV
jgi:hypothetical protein